MVLEVVRTAAVTAIVLTASVVSMVTALVLLVLEVLMPATASLIATAAHILSAFKTAISLRVVCA